MAEFSFIFFAQKVGTRTIINAEKGPHLTVLGNKYSCMFVSQNRLDFDVVYT